MKEHGDGERLPRIFGPGAAEDAEYLKKYVKKHPDNKMAWYLLGRDYAAKGKTEKALYCYAQAGEVYEAFEQNPVPAVLTDDAGELRQSGDTERYRNGAVRLSLVSALFLLLFLFVPPAEVEWNSGHSPADAVRSARSAMTQEREKAAPEAAGVAPTGTERQSVRVLYTVEDESGEELDGALRSVAMPGEMKAEYALLLQAGRTADRKWVEWTKRPALVLSAQKTAGGAVKLSYYDAANCRCKPEPASGAYQVYESWRTQQEQLLVLRSAVAAYKRLHGKPPASIGEITAHYPGNILPGYTALMNEAFGSPDAWDNGTDAKSLANEERTVSGQNQRQSRKPFVFPADPHLSEPLQIIVDKKNHRLALVSGTVIIRNYPVGLGGDKTPEGQFVISEKVRNPNGKSNGEFGSRGMTLSDTPYAIHGTNEPSSIGKNVSLGCIRMLKEDIEELYDMTPIGTKVTIWPEGLPSRIMRAEKRFSLPSSAEETNPDKIYKWL